MVLELKNGGRNELWARMEMPIGKFLAHNSINAVNAKTIDQMAGGIIIEGMRQGVPVAFDRILGTNVPSLTTAKSTKTKTLARLWPFPFPGGIRGAHIHYQGEVYLLNETLWKKFSAEVVKDVQDRISRANVVSFEQLMNIDEATASLI